MRALARPVSRPCQYGRVGRQREQQRQVRAHLVGGGHRRRRRSARATWTCSANVGSRRASSRIEPATSWWRSARATRMSCQSANGCVPEQPARRPSVSSTSASRARRSPEVGRAPRRPSCAAASSARSRRCGSPSTLPRAGRPGSAAQHLLDALRERPRVRVEEHDLLLDADASTARRRPGHRAQSGCTRRSRRAPTCPCRRRPATSSRRARPRRRRRASARRGPPPRARRRRRRTRRRSTWRGCDARRRSPSGGARRRRSPARSTPRARARIGAATRSRSAASRLRPDEHALAAVAPSAA